MSEIGARCHVCGDIKLTEHEIRLQLSKKDCHQHYSFTCPTCKDTVQKPATHDVIALLIKAGVVPEVYVIPEEYFEIEQINLPPLTYDELLEFHQSAERSDHLVSQVFSGG